MFTYTCMSQIYICCQVIWLQFIQRALLGVGLLQSELIFYCLTYVSTHKLFLTGRLFNCLLIGSRVSLRFPHYSSLFRPILDVYFPAPLPWPVNWAIDDALWAGLRPLWSLQNQKDTTCRDHCSSLKVLLSHWLISFCKEEFWGGRILSSHLVFDFSKLTSLMTMSLVVHVPKDAFHDSLRFSWKSFPHDTSVPMSALE